MAARLWTSTLRDISDEVIERAIEDCTEIFKWPPEISEFKQHCLALRGSKLIPWSHEIKNYENPGPMSNLSKKIKTEIDEGADICKRIKQLFPDDHWMVIGEKFNKIKIKSKLMFPNENSINLIRNISRYTDNDILDILNTEN